MIEGSILRAGNQSDVHEMASANALGYLVLQAKTDIMAKLLEAFEPNITTAQKVGWWHFCPFARDRIRVLHRDLLVALEGYLVSHAMVYEQILVHEITTSGFPATIDYSPWDNNLKNEFMKITIEGKVVGDYIEKAIETHGRRILSACEASVVQQISIADFAASVGRLVNNEMEVLKNSIELAFYSYAAQWIREINKRTAENYGAAIYAD